MTRIGSSQTRLDQAVELVSQLSFDEIKQLLQRVPALSRRSDENQAAYKKRLEAMGINPKLIGI